MKSKKLTEEQQTKAQARRERFHALVKQAAQMPDQERTQLRGKFGGFVVTCEGYRMSAMNTKLLLLQRQGVSMVGGFRQWLKQNRVVKKGEHGLMIWIPKKKVDNETPGAPEANETAKESEASFYTGTVFDISQTTEIETPQATQSCEALRLHDSAIPAVLA